ncbi:polyamine aminopropyltransferase [Paenibacillus sp. MBLB4367]|uniref:polyamine aminopropyltransferase n=1 Tax=Paenibacillus sp. MBLB4367 TaxID=3384767 RepID=UPI003907FE1D
MGKPMNLTGYYKEGEREELWLYDDVPEMGLEIGYKIERLLHYEQSSFQEISVVETAGFGRMLVLDGIPQSTAKEGFIYNEMLTHVPLTTHPEPNKVAIIGGGDCGAARETAKYADVKRIDVVEIDARVVEVSRAWLSNPAIYEIDDRVHLIYRDGLHWIKGQKATYDVLIVDRSDPYGPSTALYKPAFYELAYRALNEDGIFVCHAESPYYNPNIMRDTVRNLNKLFPIVRVYLAAVPVFPGGIWSFVIASKKWDPLHADIRRLQWRQNGYMNPELFEASFALPNYVKKALL